MSETEGGSGRPETGDAGAAVDTAEGPSDAALLDAVREGDADAFDVVYRRHVDAAGRLARVLTRDQAEADDLVAESFARLLSTLNSGGGPESAVRSYVLTTMRRVHIDRGRSGSKVEPVEDVADFEHAEAPDDPAVAKLDQTYAAQAFAGLPERWQAVLWHTEVEGESAAQVAPLLGLNPNAVSAIAYRARERLRQLYLQQHLAGVEGRECRWCTERLGAYVRDKLGSRESARVREHLDECDSCRIIYLDLVEVNAGFRFLIAPVVLGTAATPYLAAAGKTAGLFGFLPAVWGWWKKTSSNPAAGVAAAVVLVLALGVTAWATVGDRILDDDGRQSAQSAQPTGGGQGNSTQAPATSEPSSEPSSSKSKAAATSPQSPEPTDRPTQQPTSAPPESTDPAPSSRPAQPAPEPPPDGTEPPPDPPTEDETEPPPPDTETPPDEPPETQDPPPESNEPSGVCLRIPILSVCLGGDGNDRERRSESPQGEASRGRDGS